MVPTALEPIAYIRHGAADDVVKEEWAELVGTVEGVPDRCLTFRRHS